MIARDSAQQLYIPPVQQLGTFANALGGVLTPTFRVAVPDSRLRVKISLLWLFTPGHESDITGSGSVWIYAADQDLSGALGRELPTTNLEGTQAAPTTFPATNGLRGYSREFVTSADYIEGALTLAPNAPGTWALQCRYQPESVRFTDAEWTEIQTRMKAMVSGYAVSSG